MIDPEEIQRDWTDVMLGKIKPAYIGFKGRTQQDVFEMIRSILLKLPHRQLLNVTALMIACSLDESLEAVKAAKRVADRGDDTKTLGA